VIRRILLTLAAAALTFVGAAPAALADTTYTACNGVWVIVDYGSLGGVSTACATSYSTGTTALRSAGFSPTLDNGFLTKINGKPSAPDPQTAYWSYWQATRQADGSYSGWKYASTGANSSHPVKGNAEGWHYVSVSGGASAPGATPPKNPAQAAPAPTATSAPTATKTSTAPSTKASTKPTSTSSSAATTKPSTSSAEPKTSSASPSPSGAATSPSASSATDAPSADPPGIDVPAGSPIAVIATTSALAVGAAGAGGWWLWKGRRR
jgi:hypothetical protein